MPVFEITSPDGRVLEIEGDKAPSESELDNIFKSIPVESNKGSINQSALSNVKSTDDEPEIGMSIAERFNKLRQDSVQYAANIPQKEAGMSWVEYAKLRKKYDEDWGLNTPDLNPLKSIWKMSILGSINEKLYRGQKEKRAGKYIDNTEVLTEVPAQALADWEKKGQIKAGEAFIRSDWSRTIPFLGSGTAIDEATDIKKIIDKKNKGEELSKKEITQLNAYILDVAEQNYRGVSFGGKLIQGALELPSFAGEFMATGGLASIGKNAIQKTITRGLQEATKKEVGKRLTKGLLEGAAGAVTRTSLGMPQRVAENYGMRKLHESLGITDKGQVVLETADTSPALTFLKAWGDTVIENWSEEMGAGLGEAAGLSFKSLNKLASPLEKKLFSRDTRAAFIKAMRTLRPNATVKDIMTRAGFNGILEEMGEERAGSVLRVIFGIDDRQDVSTFEKLCEAINPGAEELLLELGLFSIPGSMSFAASQVARHLRNQNVDEQTISDYMKLTSELEKEKFLGDIADNKDLTNAINFENDVRDLKNRYFTQNLNAGLEKEEALAAADIQSNAVSSLAKNIGMDINELNREFAINTQSLTAEQAKAEQQADSLVLRGGVEMNVANDTKPQFQSAMYKSPKKDFEEFYNQVFEKESEIKESKSKQKKSYFDYTNENISVRIPHDTVIHDENRHRLSAEEWHNVLSNLDTPADVAYSNKPRFDGQPLLLKIIGNNNETYGVVVETFEKKQPIITTVFIDSEENIDKWLNKNRAAQAKNTSSVTTKGMLLSQNPNSIITEVRKKLKPVRTQGSFDNSNSNIYYQSAYHGTPHRFDEFSLENIGTGEGMQAHGWGLYFAENKDVSEKYRKNLSGDDFNNEQYFYNGELVEERNKKAILSTIVKNGIDKVIQVREKNLEKYKYNEAEYQTKKEELEWIKTLDESKIEKKTNNGQLFKVDIPEADVLLDEDNLLIEQEENIKEKLKDVAGQIYQDRTDFDTNIVKSKEFQLIEDVKNGKFSGQGFDYTGRDFYNSLAKILGSPKEASLYLNDFGVKGITYDGWRDGRCYVVFDDKRIDILKTYYQAENSNIVDLTDDFEKSPTIQEVKNYINKIVENGTKFATLSPEWFVDISSNRRSKKKIWNDGNYKGLDRKGNVRHNKYIMSLEKLLANAEYVGAKENTKKDKKPNVEKYHYFKTNVKIGDKIYEIIFDTEEYKNENPQGANTKTVLPKEHLEDTNSITDNAAGFNPKTVHLYNITEIKKPETYYHSGDDYNPIDDARGFTYQRFNFDGTTKDNLIVLLKNKSDKSTLLHEFAHVYLTTLNNLALRNVRAKELLNTVNKWLNYNGVEYTTKQHEKFANGFVAYVKSGKAPTYGLKRAFENFKRWLNDLYTNLSMSEEIELDDKAKTVFDELLGDNTIEAKDKKVAELIDKAKQNALLRLNYEYAEKRKITPLHLTERQRRFRDTAYDILFTAAIHTKDSDGNPLVKNKQELYMLFGNNSNYQKKNKGIKLRKEKIEQYLLEVDDPFSGGDGFQRNWAEFFYDPGVSYENMTAGADSELVKQALDVINEKRYLYDSNNLNNKNEFSEEDIKKAQYELEYLIDDYKNTKNKDITMAAFFDWADSVHPYIQEDIITQWENRTNEIDRYDNLTEFQKAKEDLKIYAATLEGYGDYSSQFAEYARKIIKRLDFMTEHDKMKIFDKLKDYSSFREIERNLDSVMDYAETLNDVSLRKNLADTIINEIKRTTPEIVKGTKKTRYDYQTNKLFERLREINRMKQEQVKDLYDAYVNGELERRAAQFEENGTITGKTEDYFEDIENSFIQFKANGIYYNSTESLQTLLDKIQNAKFTGKVARDEIDFQQRMNQQNWINNCAQAVEAHKNKVGQLEELYSMEANFDSLLSMIFDDKIKNKFSLDLLYAQVDGKVGKDREEVLNKIADIFGYKGILKGTMLNNKFIEMANDKYKIKQRYANKYETDNLGVWDWETITLSKMEILYYYIQAKNPTSYEMLTDMGDETRAPKGQFDRGEFEELLSNLTPQEKLMGDVLQMAAEKYYPELNKYHIKKHHIDMGKVTCYFPRKSELKEVNELDLFNQYTEKSTNPKFVKMRSAGPSIRITPANPVNVLFNHIQKANTIIIMGEQLDLMNKVFRDNDLRVKIQSVFGDKVYTEFMQHVTANLYDGQVTTLSNAEGIISRLMSNIIAAPMFIKPQIGIKQVLGLINYGLGNEYVGSIEWLKAFIKTMKHPREAIDFMMNDEYLKDRLTRANLNEAMKNHIDNKLFSRVSLLNDYFSLNMRFGDLLNLCWGGKAYIDVLMKKGFTKEQAFELFRQKTISDQQSSINSTLSNLQRNSKNNPFARLLFAYQNTPHQYFRICANAVIQAKQGKISKRQAVKTIFLYWYVLPLIFNMAGSLSPITLLTTGDPDELYTDMRISCLGSITCLPFIGEWVRAAWAGVTGEEYFGERDWFTRVAQITASSINKFKKDELSFEDILKSLEIFAQGAGIPLEAIDTQIEAVGDYAQGDIAKGFLKTLGFSRYRAKKVTGED